jgi:hypothetical protein
MNVAFLVGFEAFIEVILTISLFWDIMPCSPLKISQYFGETYRLRLHSGRIRQARNKLKQQVGHTFKTYERIGSTESGRLISRFWNVNKKGNIDPIQNFISL